MELFLKSFAAAFFSAQLTGRRLMTGAENKIEYFLCTVVSSVILSGAAVGAGALAGGLMPIYAARSAAAVIFSCLACAAAFDKDKNTAGESAVAAPATFLHTKPSCKALLCTVMITSGCPAGDLKALLEIFAGCLTALICASSGSSLVKGPHNGARRVISFAVFAFRAAARTAAGSAFAVSLCTVCFIKSRKNDRKKLPVFRYG